MADSRAITGKKGAVHREPGLVSTASSAPVVDIKFPGMSNQAKTGMISAILGSQLL